MRLSYWEYKTWLTDVDFTIVGSGIVGLNCALALRKNYPASKILVLEKGVLPQGASTKNAGFACFGSISEILSDLDSHSEQEVVELVQMRWEGINYLRENIGDRNLSFHQCGGFELFQNNDSERYDRCVGSIDKINELLKAVFKEAAFRLHPNTFNFGKVKENSLFHKFEGQIDTGKMMWSLLQKAHNSGIGILNSVAVKDYVQVQDGVEIETDLFSFRTDKLFIATNGFAPEEMKLDVKPARAQVLITKPVPDLHIDGTFQMDEGFYYFRNVDNRILLGGARNIDPENETTTEFGLSSIIQDRLEKVLKDVILVDKPFEIDQRWSGIMGVGSQKRPIIKALSNNVFCGIRLGGMGVAIGSQVGKELAGLQD